MKKPLLFTLLLASTAVNAQMTQANEPAINETTTMFLCDSFTVNLDGINGSGVTWDYSSILGYYGETRVVDVVDPATTAYASDFPTSTKAFQVENAMITYYNSTPTERVSQGFTFSEPSLGDFVTTLGPNEQTTVTYPFPYGSVLGDTYDGFIDFDYQGLPVNEAVVGNAYAWADGEGTLLLPNAVSLNNVLRYKSIDTAFTNLPVIGAAEVIRVQYEYYDYATQNLPVFIHTSITIAQPGGLPLAEVSMVLSKFEANYLSVENQNEIDFSVYPNPSADHINIKGDFSAEAKGVIVDQNGRELKSMNISNGIEIDMTDLASGIYLLTISDKGFQTTKTIVKK